MTSQTSPPEERWVALQCLPEHSPCPHTLPCKTERAACKAARASPSPGPEAPLHLCKIRTPKKGVHYVNNGLPNLLVILGVLAIRMTPVLGGRKRNVMEPVVLR